jgi:hypothetical protein
MKRTLFAATIAAQILAFPAITFAADAGAEPPVVDAKMEALIQQCLDHNLLLPDQLQTMTDVELNAALVTCAATLQTAQSTAAPAPVVRTATPVVVQSAAPVIVHRRQRFVVNEAPAIVEPGPININNNSGNNIGNGNVVGGALGGLGGGNAGPVGGGDGAVTPTPAPVANGLDARIAGLESGIQEGIKTSALTTAEAAQVQANLGAIQGLRANLGDTPAARLIIQAQLDAAIADFNSKVHDNVGVPNPDLFRALKRNGQQTAGLNSFAGSNRFAGMRARLAAAKNGQISIGAGHSRFAAIRARMAAAKDGQLHGANATDRNHNRFAAYLRHRKSQGALGQTKTGSMTASGSSSSKARFVQRRIARIRQARTNNANVSSKVSSQSNFRHVVTSSGGKSHGFVRRRLASTR